MSAVLQVAAVLLISGCIRSPKPTLTPPHASPSPLFTESPAVLKDLAAKSGSPDVYLSLARENLDHQYYTAAAARYQEARSHGAPDSAVSAELGRSLFAVHRNEEALVEFKRAVPAGPVKLSQVADIASVYDDMDRADEAKRELTIHVALLDAAAAADKPAILRVITLARRLGNRTIAVKAAQSLLRIVPDDVDGYAELGREMLEQGKYADASELLVRAVEMKPDDALLHYRYGVALLHLGGKPVHDQGLKELQNATSIDKSLGAAYLEQGNELLKRKQWVPAANGLMLAGSSSQDPLAFRMAAGAWRSANMATQSLYCEAVALEIEGNYAQAIPKFQALAATAETIWKRRGLDGLTNSYRLMGRNPDYLKYALESTSLGSVNDYLAAASAYAALHDTGNQVKYLNMALQHDSSAAGLVHSQLGTIAEAYGRKDEAERELLLAISADADRVEYRRSLVRVYLSRRELGDRLKRAVEEGERAASSPTARGEDFHQLGVAYAAQGRLEPAIRALQHAIDLEPAGGAYYLELARLLPRAGRSEEGDRMMRLYREYDAREEVKKTLSTAARANKNDPAAQAALGDYFAKVHDFKQAADQYALALSLAPASDLWKQKLQRCRSLAGREEPASGAASVQGTP